MLIYGFLVGNALCPVKSFELYTFKIDPDYKSLWQLPKSSVTWQDAYWFEAAPLSKNKIGSLMSILSKEAGLSKQYTNHCIRNTCITILDRAGHEARHIMTISGHKKMDSITSYAHRTSDNKKRQMSETLANALVSKPCEKVVKFEENVVRKPTATISVPPAETTTGATDETFPTINGSELGQLLQLTQEQERDLMNELLNTPFDIPAPPAAPAQAPQSVNNVVKTVSNVNDHRPSLASVTPRMVFQNSNVTINFNVNKEK